MYKKKMVALIKAAEISRERRREEVANLYFLEGYSVEEIAEYSVYAVKTIERDVSYIREHWQEFF